MQRYDICAPKKYQKDGVEKTQWNRVGTLIYFEARDGKEAGYKLELSMFPGTDFAVFKQKPKEGGYEAPRPQKEAPEASQAVDEIDPNDIPF